MAPEVTSGSRYDTKCDVYSYAIIMYEVLMETLSPYGKQVTFNIEQRVMKDPTFRPEVKPQSDFETDTERELCKWMQRCWSHQPADRPSFEELCTALSACEFM